MQNPPRDENLKYSNFFSLGVSNENYQFGTQFIVINLSYGLATPICAYLFLPVFYKLQATSAYEVKFNSCPN